MNFYRRDFSIESMLLQLFCLGTIFFLRIGSSAEFLYPDVDLDSLGNVKHCMLDLLDTLCNPKRRFQGKTSSIQSVMLQILRVGTILCL